MGLSVTLAPGLRRHTRRRSPLGVGRSDGNCWNISADPDYAAVLPELHGLQFGIPVGIFGGRCWETVRLALSCSMLRSHEERALREGATCQRQARSTAIADEVIE